MNDQKKISGEKLSKKKSVRKNNIEKKYNAKKKYGQNFLNDSELSDKILEVADIREDTEIIEIGPGLGFLTEKLVNRSKHLTAFEIDDDLIPILNKKFGNNKNFLLIHKDFLEVDLEKILENKKNIKVVANIPYYIRTRMRR